MKKLFENVLIEVVLSDDIITSKEISKKLDLNLNITKAILKTLHEDQLIETASINDEKGKFLGSGFFATEKGLKNYHYIVIYRIDKKAIKKSDKKETYLLILLAMFFSLLVGYMLCKILTI